MSDFKDRIESFLSSSENLSRRHVHPRLLKMFELGGMNTPVELEALLYGALTATDHNHDLIAHALNERFVELGGNHPVPYSAL